MDVEKSVCQDPLPTRTFDLISEKRNGRIVYLLMTKGERGRPHEIINDKSVVTIYRNIQ